MDVLAGEAEVVPVRNDLPIVLVVARLRDLAPLLAVSYSSAMRRLAVASMVRGVGLRPVNAGHHVVVGALGPGEPGGALGGVVGGGGNVPRI